MSRARRSSPVVLPYLGAIAVFFLAQQFGRGSHLFTDVLTKERIAPFSSLAKLAAQLLGSIFAGLCARRYESGSTTRRAWVLMSTWLGMWFLGQTVLVGYVVLADRVAPVPSLGDLFFTVGCVAVIAALFMFAAAYRASGFAVGSKRDHAIIALGACAVFGPIGYLVLLPVALAPTPLAERLVNVGYPVFDLITLIPAIVLLRIAIGFRGGQVWRVWGALLAGIVFAMGGDVVFSDMTPANLDAVGPIADLFFILGYSFSAYGMRLQYEMLTD